MYRARPYGQRPPPPGAPYVDFYTNSAYQRPPPPRPPRKPYVRPSDNRMFGAYGGYGGQPAGGSYIVRPRNNYFPGRTVTTLSFLMLILALLVLVAQIGLYYYCGWDNTICLVVPTFVAVILFVITSIIGVAAGVERTNGLILTLMVMSLITVIVTPINMGLMGIPKADGGIPLDFALVEGGNVSSTLAAIYWGVIFIPILHWILFVVIVCVCGMALCCPNYGDRTIVHPTVSPVYGSSPRPYLF